MRARRTDYPPLSPEAAAAVAQLGEVLRSVPKVAKWVVCGSDGGHVTAVYERPATKLSAAIEAKAERQRVLRREAKERYRAKLRAAGVTP